MRREQQFKPRRNECKMRCKLTHTVQHRYDRRCERRYLIWQTSISRRHTMQEGCDEPRTQIARRTSCSLDRTNVDRLRRHARLTIEYGNAGMWRGPERISNSVGLEPKGNQSPDQQRDSTSLNHKHRNGVVRLAGCPLLG